MKAPKSILFLAVFLALHPNFSRAATVTWTNTAGGNWSGTDNWSPNHVPGSTDDAVITNVGTYEVVLDETADVSSLTVGGSGGLQTFSVNGENLTIGTAATFNARGNFNFDGGSLGGAGTITMSGSNYWSAGYWANGGLNQIGAVGQLVIDTTADHDMPDTTFDNLGTVLWQGGRIRGGSTYITNNGSWLVRTDNVLNSDYGGAGVVFYNNSLFQKASTSGTTSLIGSTTFINSNLVDIQTGTLEIECGGSGTGTFQAEGPGTISFDSGGYTFEDESTFVGAGNILLNSGEVTFAGTFSSTNLQWVAAQIFGTPTNSAGNVFYIVSGSDHNMPDVTFDNLGTVLWLGGRIRGGSTFITNNGTWLVQTDNVINDDYGGSGMWFYNNDLFQKTTTTGTTAFLGNAFLINAGLVDIQTGTLDIEGGGSSTATFQAEAGATISFDSGNFTFGNGSTFQGAGNIRLNSGEVTFAGNFTSTNLQWVAAQIAGTPTNVAGNVFYIITASDHNMPNVTFNNTGTVLWQGGRIRGGSTRIYNNGSWFAQTDNVINADYGGFGMWFYNNNLFRKTTTTGTTEFLGNAFLINGNLVDTQTGQLTINDGGGTNLSGGVFNAASGATNNFINTYTFENGTVFGGTGLNILDGGFYIFHGSFTCANGLVWYSGQFAGLAINSLNSILDIVSANDHNMPNVTFTNLGSIVHTGGGRVRGGSTILNNVGTWFEETDSVINADYGGFGFDFYNSGTFKKTVTTGSSTTFNPEAFLFNTGIVDDQSGLIEIDDGGGASTGGTFNAAAGAHIDFENTYTLNGQNNFTGAGVVSWNGTMNLHGTINSANLQWQSGYITGSGTNPVGSVLSITTASDHDMPNASLYNFGQVIRTGGGRVRGGSSLISNSGTWLEQTDAVFNDDYGGSGATFANIGTFRKNTTTGTSSFLNGAYLENSGLVDIQTGTLVIADNGGSSTGTFQAESGTLCSWQAFYTFNTGTQFLGAGTNSLTALANFTGNFFSVNMEWDSGQWEGTATNLPGSSFKISTTADHNMPDAVVANLGTIIHNGGRVRGGSSAIYNSGTWLDETDSVINDDYGGSPVQFVNSGTFHRVGDTGSSTFTTGTDLINSGVVIIENGSVVCQGTYTHSNGTLNFGVTSATPAVYGTLGLSGSVTFNGTLAIHLIGGYTPVLGDALTLITYSSFSGHFANLSLSPVPAGDMWQVNYNPANLVIKVVAPGPATPQIFGSVKDAPTHGVPGLTVAAFTTNNPSVYTSTTTGANGQYTVGVTNGDWVVGVENLAAAGYNPVPDQTTIISGANQEVDFLIQATGATTPGAATLAATGVTASGAMLNGTASPNGEAVSVFYQYGLSSAYGQFTPTNTISANLNTTQPVPMAISGLAAGTTYHFQIVVANSIGTTGGGDQTFLTASAPNVITEAASNVGTTNAAVNGSINPNGLASTWYFEYGTDLSYGSDSPTSSIPAGFTTLVVTNELTNLSPATVYHFQLVGANTSGTNFGGDMTFTNGPTAPYVTTLPATSVTASSATLNASINPNGEQTMAFIEYGLDTSYGNFTPTNTFAAGNSAMALVEPLNGLSPNQTYHFRAVGWNSLGTNLGVDLTFSVTVSGAPTVITETPTDIGSTNGTLNGSINPNGLVSTWYFEYGTGLSYGSYSTTSSIPAGSVSLPVASELTNLAPATLYHYQLVGVNANGANFGGDQTLTTASTAPSVTTLPASGITVSSGILNGSVVANGVETMAFIEYGLDTSYGNFTPTNTFIAGNTPHPLSDLVSGLALNQTYHFRAVAWNSLGTNSGADLIFTVAPSGTPIVLTEAATAIGSTNGTINGSINPNGLASTWYFEYGTDTSYGSYSPTSSIAAGMTSMVVTNEITNLAPATPYHFQLVGSNVLGASLGGDLSFTTASTAPSVTTLPASGVAASVATLNASVNPNGEQTMVYIEYGLTISYGSFTPTNTLAAGNTAQAIADITGGLSPGLTYHFRAVGWNSLGTNQGADLTFATGPIAPQIQCPGDIETNSTGGQCQQVVSFAVTVEAGDPAPMVTYELNGSPITSPYAFPVGESMVSVTATNIAGTNTCSFTVTVVGEELPIAGPNQMGTSEGSPAVVDVAKMLLSCTSPNGLPLSITSVASPTIGGATVSLGGGKITYSPTATFIGQDTLNYTLSDGCGTAPGTINVLVVSTNLPSPNQMSLTLDSGGIPTVVFAGVPGATYVVQVSPTLSSGPWSDSSGPIVAASNGLVQYTDLSDPEPPVRFYRTRWVSGP